MAQKAFVNAKTKAGITPLHLAASNGYTELTKLLIEKYNATIDVTTMDKKTPLHLAAENGQKSVTHTLINLKANVNAKDSVGQTPLHLAAESDHSDVVKMFLKYNPELVFTATQDGMTCAHIAAAKGSVAVVKELMRFNRQIVTSARNKTTNSLPLHLAAEGGHSDVVKILIDAGSSPLDENDDGMTCIHLAAKEGYPNVLGAIPPNIAWGLASRKTGLTPLHVAAFYAKTDMVRELLVRVAPDICTQRSSTTTLRDEKLKELINIDYGFTPLHVACFAGVDQVVRLLLNIPTVNAEAQSAVQKRSALHLAAQSGSLSVASLLLTKSTKLLSQEDSKGLKPLHLAARDGQTEMISNLIGQGADINTTDNVCPIEVVFYFTTILTYLIFLQHGWVPLHHASRSGRMESVKLLLELGASVTHTTREDRVPLSLAAASGHIDVFMFLLNKEHDTEKLLEDSSFVLDLMLCGKMTKQQAVEEFILVSKSPLGTAALLSHSFLKLAENDIEHAKDLESVSKFCEKITTTLMSIGALQSSPAKILQAVNAKGKQFIEALLDDNLKTVVAESSVQRYLTEIWDGKLDWGGSQFFFLFIGLVLFPPLVVYFTLPLSHGYFKIPIIKFLCYLASHIHFIIVLSTVCVVPLYPVPTRDNFYPTWNEVMLAFWLGGNLTAELTNLIDRKGARFIKCFNLALCSIASLCQIIAITLP